MRIRLLGCDIDNLTMEETLAKIEGFINSRVPRRHVAINAYKILLAKKDPGLRRIINSCDLIGVDGVPVIWASRILGRPLKERINGTDLMEKLIAKASEKDYRLYFLGAKDKVIRHLVEICRIRYPGMQIAGFRNGYWEQDQEQEVVEAIRKARPDILFVGVSSPKKEIFLKKYSEAMEVPFTMCVGGSFDVVAGLGRRRAPLWMQRNGLEWLFRFIQEPRRMWRRYLIGNTAFVFLILKELVKIRILNSSEAE